MATLIWSRLAPDLVFVAALTALMVTGVLSPAEALAGVSNPGLATIGVLYVVAAGLVDTGAIHLLGARLMGQPRSTAAAQSRLMLPVTCSLRVLRLLRMVLESEKNTTRFTGRNCG